jgi:hypothetical protein
LIREGKVRVEKGKERREKRRYPSLSYSRSFIHNIQNILIYFRSRTWCPPKVMPASLLCCPMTLEVVLLVAIEVEHRPRGAV